MRSAAGRLASAGSTATCASRSPTAATSAAPTACRKRACAWLPARRAAHLRGDRAHRPGLRRALRLRRASASPAASPRCGPTSRCSSSKLARARRRPGAHHQRRHAPARSPTTSRPPGCVGSTSPSTRCAPTASRGITRRDELDRVLDGIDAAVDAGLAPGEAQRGRDAGRERRRDRRLRPLRPGAGRRRCASSSSCRSTPRGRGARRRCVTPGRDRRAHRRRASRSSPPMPLERATEPAERFRYLDGAGRGRGHPERHRTRSAGPATGSGSPPRASCATACSPWTRPTCRTPLRARRGRRRPRRGSSRPRSAAKWAGHQIGPGALHPARAGR